MHPYQSVIDQSEKAVLAVADLIGEARVNEALDYILKHDEWLLGLEFVIDWLSEDDIKITVGQYASFERAYEMMGRPEDERLKTLSSLIQAKR